MTNKTALITGGATGIGKATAKKLASQSVNLVVSGRREALAREAIADIQANEAGLAALHPINRLGEPDEIANRIAWLLSDEASVVVGQVLNIDGGYQAK